jgi:hypothetical protein
MKRKIKRGNKEQIKKELTSESYASLMSRSPEAVYPCPWRWGFFPLEAGEEMRNDGGVCEWICRAPHRLFY